MSDSFLCAGATLFLCVRLFVHLILGCLLCFIQDDTVRVRLFLFTDGGDIGQKGGDSVVAVDFSELWACCTASTVSKFIVSVQRDLQNGSVNAVPSQFYLICLLLLNIKAAT